MDLAFKVAGLTLWCKGLYCCEASIHTGGDPALCDVSGKATAGGLSVWAPSTQLW